MDKVTQLLFSENSLSDSLFFDRTHTRLFSFGRDIIYKLSKDPRIREIIILTLLYNKGIILELSIIK